MAERWLPCPCDPNYEVSDLGRVRRIGSEHCRVPTANHKQNRPGYLKLNLTGGKQRYVHQLVAEAFLGPAPAGHNVDHENHNRWDNTLANLRYLPKPENDFRWKARVDGRNVWESPYLGNVEEPEGHAPLTEEEACELDREREASGW